MNKKLVSESRGFGAVLLLAAILCTSTATAQISHDAWQSLLVQYVQELDGGRVTRVDYRGLTRERDRLQAYLDGRAAVSRQDFDSWPVDSQLAFLINAYNAWTVELILSEYPGLDSIRDIGFLPGAAWRRRIVSLFGSQVSLDDVEHGMIRGWERFREPRIHFAVNCAAIGCPALRAEAYTGEKLQRQLEDATRLFLSDRDRNYLDGDTAWVSRLFDWYEEDFQRGWDGVDSVPEFLLRYVDALGMDETDIARMKGGEIRLRYLDYDWGLNSVRH